MILNTPIKINSFTQDTDCDCELDSWIEPEVKNPLR